MRGSHNTLTYGRPCRWWGWLLVPLWRCQRRDLPAQIDHGCRVFDIRVARRGDRWYAAHGIVDIAVDPVAAILKICSCLDRPYIRVILEKGNAEDAREFVQLCRYLERLHPDARFFGGVLKPGWKQLYRFQSDDGSLERGMTQYVGSMQSRWYGKLLPGLWTWIHRHDALPDAAASPELPIVLTDMV